jgi:hypothetical protein
LIAQHINISMNNWSKASFIEWLINSFIPQNKLDAYEFPIESYLSLSENSIKNLVASLNEKDFEKLDQNFGALVCENLHSLNNYRVSKWKLCDFLR